MLDGWDRGQHSAPRPLFFSSPLLEVFVSKTVPTLANPELLHLRGEGASLIRAHLWQSKTPPPSPDHKPWSMARELNIWTLLYRDSDGEQINGAIEVVRSVSTLEGPLRMTIFYHRAMRPLFEQCKAYWLRTQEIQFTKSPERLSEVFTRIMNA